MPASSTPRPKMGLCIQGIPLMPMTGSSLYRLLPPLCHLHGKTSNLRKCNGSKFNDGIPRQRVISSRDTGVHHHRHVILLTEGQLEPLDLTEENVRQVLIDARSEFLQLFDSSVGITGVAELAEIDGPYVKLSLKGRFWHKRSTVLARLATYLQQRIPEILEVDIEDEAQLDDSPENF